MTEDENDLPAASGQLPVPKRPRVSNLFECGSGPCRAVRVVEGESRRVANDLPAVEKPGKP